MSGDDQRPIRTGATHATVGAGAPSLQRWGREPQAKPIRARSASEGPATRCGPYRRGGCQHCGQEISGNDSYEYLGQTLCEDCYLDLRYPAKSCDPWAVYTATRTRESQGLTGAEGLTGLQKTVYEYIKEKGKVTAEELMVKLNLSEPEMKTQVAALRHSELVKGQKDGDKVYLVPFDA